MAKDPVCGMEVDETTALNSEHDDRKFYFCSAKDKETFDKDPHTYAHGTG